MQSSKRASRGIVALYKLPSSLSLFFSFSVHLVPRYIHYNSPFRRPPPQEIREREPYDEFRVAWKSRRRRLFGVLRLRPPPRGLEEIKTTRVPRGFALPSVMLFSGISFARAAVRNMGASPRPGGLRFFGARRRPDDDDGFRKNG